MRAAGCEAPVFKRGVGTTPEGGAVMGVYEIYSPLLVDVSPKWVRHSPCMGEIVHPPAGVYSPTHRCLLPYPPVFTPPTRWCLLPLPAGVYFPHPPVFTSPTHRCLLPPRAGVYLPPSMPLSWSEYTGATSKFPFSLWFVWKETLLSVSLGLVDVNKSTRACRVLAVPRTL